MPLSLFRGRIARRITLLVLAASFAVTLATTGFQLYRDYRSGLADIEKRFAYISSAYLESLSESVWVHDEVQILLQLEGLTHMPDLEHLAIRIDGKLKWEVGERHSQKILHAVFPLQRHYRQQPVELGTLEVTAGLDGLHRRLIHKVAAILLYNSIEVFLVAGVLLFLFNFMVGLPLARIAAYLQALKLNGEKPHPLAISRRLREADQDELEYVVESINLMTRKLSQAHQELEGKVRERTAELEAATHLLQRSNRDLQDFAHIISHDLKEPLRMVSSYLQLLDRRYRGKLDQSADEFIGFAVDGAQRMAAMIDGLLEYSRVESKGAAFAEIDLEHVLADALNNLQVAVEESAAEITHGPLPTVAADAAQMERLLQNLLGNALKFRQEAPPKVRIEARRQNREWVVSVADDGIGIPPDKTENIFAMFQRLHTREEYPGTGIGLAVCKRIVERHGGRIWVESKPGEGAVFYFSLPIDFQEKI